MWVLDRVFLLLFLEISKGVINGVMGGWIGKIKDFKFYKGNKVLKKFFI